MPELGWAFRSENRTKEKTELIVLITPRVIDDPGEWAQICVGMQQAFQHLRLPEPALATAPAAAQVPAGPCADSDGDGVCDAVDRCPQSLGGAAVDAEGCETGEVILRGVTFELGTAQLTPGDKLLLDSVAEMLASRPDVRAEIRGHTDDIGEEDFNLRLSRQRAEAVRSYLILKGITDDRLVASGLGETAPIASNATEEGRAQNRRVTLELLRGVQ